MTGSAHSETAFLRALGKRLRLLRLTREMTQEELGEAAGVSRSFVSVIEHGASSVDVVRLYRLAAVLGLTLSELVDELPAVPPTRTDRAEGLPS